MLPQSHSNCISACRECVAACEAWLELVPRLSALADRRHCAELCQSSIRLCRLVMDELKVRSAFAIQVCALGTVICRACADEFSAEKGLIWQACSTACLRAAEECHAIATLTPAHAPV